ncbi:glycine--tRNA ligase subunit beta [Peptacetobacter hominis]|uniref:Glycine--tRNA ligase beta subunit n=1 Tax=Peptacetobacter hominis TaxID=2743610 RepID=A0A544QYL5_9FIRM|nr:glycine--tRNA ligase subunit beta [Peptacetobacter hominis]TQQ85740.1 glycine--tRNA ligase subunit beta [Peptacetobacter hominis]
MNNYLLFEVGVEEMPSRFVASTLKQIKESAESMLNEKRVKFDNIKTYATPRRLTFIIEGLAEKQENLEEEVKGPSKKISLDADGNFTKPALGFMKSKGLNPEDIYFKQAGKDEYLFATIREEGAETSEVLKEILPLAVKSVVFPKAMHWAGKDIRFVRPIRWLVALLNDEVLPVDLEGIIASNVTKGHRFLGAKEITVNSVEDYMTKLRENFVILDQAERKEMIVKQAEEVAASLGGKVIMDPDLLDEVTCIVEYPTAFYGEFDKEYLKLPKKVVITPMQEHQRYFPVEDGCGNLLPNFIAVRNGNSHGIENVKAGNEKVLEARLADALFFYREDQKRDINYFKERLKTVVFQAKLGTIYDKSERLEKLAGSIADMLGCADEKADIVKAAGICKADLVTNMVFEFDELQGYMGMEYAKLDGEKEEVAKAIYEHYMPRFAGDELPSSIHGSVLSIADKLDSVAGFFAIGIQPTGSQDPYALRRQALGIINILMENKLTIDIRKAAEYALDNYTEIEFDKEKVVSEIMDFFAERIKNSFRDMGIRYDVVDAVLNSDVSDIYDMHKRASELNEWINKDELVEMLTAFNRVSTLAEKAEGTCVDENLLKEAPEKELYEAFKSVKTEVEVYLDAKEYGKALDSFASLRPAVDNMFDNVMVMDKDEALKNNRLNMLKNISDTMLKICDLNKIEYK